jgi:DNA-binding CsgD family transcriptional regulator
MGAPIGRQAERERIDAFLSAPETPPGILALVAEPGMGKTTIWNLATGLARERGYRVLSCRPAAAEARLAYSGLGDLLEGAVDETLDALPAPQRDALAVALALADPEDANASERLVALAFLRVLRRLAAESPLLVAVDDLQWLDSATARALEYVARRLGGEPIKVLAAVRREADRALPGLLAEAGHDDHVALHPLGPMTGAEIHALILDRLGFTLSRSQFLSVFEASAGNPFYAVEIARTLRESDRDATRWVPMSKNLEDLLGERIEALPDGTRELLLLASALSDPTLSVIGAARDGDETADLEPALRASVVEIEGHRIRFGHPLFASAVYGSATALERRTAHMRLAGIVEGEEERALHLALASDGPDETVAAALEGAAARAEGRGAPRAAAELAELAVELTPRGGADDAGRRRLAAGIYAWHAADGDRARRIFEQLTADLPAGPTRSDAFLHLAFTREDDDAEVARYCRLALADADGDAFRAAEIERVLGFVSMVMGDLEEALQHGAAAVEAADTSGDGNQLAGTLAFHALFRRYAGLGGDGELARALELEAGLEDLLPIYSPTIVDGLARFYDGDLDTARVRLAGAKATIDRQGNEVALMSLLHHLCELEWRAGNWPLAREHALEGLELAQQTGAKQSESAMRFCVALAAAGTGSVAEAGEAATEGARLAREVHDFLYRAHNETVLGFLELSQGSFRRAAEVLCPLLDELSRLGWREPALFGSAWPDAIEALARDGDLDGSAAYLATFAGQVDGCPSPWAAGAVARCRAVLAAAGGDPEAARPHAAEALALHRAGRQPLELARTLLVAGMVERRAKRRREARRLLGESRELFESLGAALWVVRSEDELGRIGGRASPVDELTPTERRVAERAASGETNREIAEAEFISVKTVESNLSRAYRKLRVSSRSELRRVWSERGAGQT